jgi:hypothetical protein
MKDDNKLKILKNSLFWGLILWLFGYVLGIAFYGFVPMEMLGWAIMPFGIIFTLWVLFKRIERDEFGCYFGLGLIWTIMAIVLDYVFLVMLFSAPDYYKPDVLIYYALTFVLPILVGLYKFKGVKK